jgi:trypsin
MLDFEMCAKVIENMARMRDDVVCAGFLEPGKDACQGDSGGPLVIDNKLVGIVAFGVQNEANNIYPSYFTNVASYVSWIKKNVKVHKI